MAFPDLEADWIAVIEAIHSQTKDENAWLDGMIEAATPLFPESLFVGTYFVDYSPDLRQMAAKAIRPTAWEAPMLELQRFSNEVGPQVWAPFHFTGPVKTQSEVATKLASDLESEIQAKNSKHGMQDGVALIGHPRPGRIVVLHAIAHRHLTLTKREREILTRLAFHLEAGARLRQVPGALRATISRRGKVERVDDEAPATSTLREAAADINRARKDRDGDSTALWSALVEGIVSVTPRDEGYLVVENAPEARALHALTPREAAVVELAIRGAPTKSIAYALGISPGRVSSRIASATTKLGLLSHIELVRLAALLVDIPRAGLGDEALTAAEEDVLGLLERGLSNQDIARLRERSVRTIANQVAALLKKTKSSSRRELASLSAQRRRD